MKCVAGLAGLVVMLVAGPAAAQTAPTGAAAQQAVPVERAAPSRSFLGLLSGIQVVDGAAPILGGEFGIRAPKNLQLVVEVGWFADVVTGSRVAEAASIATYLQQTRERVATSDIDAPAWFATVGLRHIHDNASGIRPYVLANVGMARVEFRPTFTLDGLNLGTVLDDLGVALGRDLLGPGKHLAYGGGGGFILGDRWYLDLGVRLTRITTTDHATNVRRINISMGRRF